MAKKRAEPSIFAIFGDPGTGDMVREISKAHTVKGRVVLTDPLLDEAVPVALDEIRAETLNLRKIDLATFVYFITPSGHLSLDLERLRYYAHSIGVGTDEISADTYRQKLMTLLDEAQEKDDDDGDGPGSEASPEDGPLFTSTEGRDTDLGDYEEAEGFGGPIRIDDIPEDTDDDGDERATDDLG